MSIINDLGSISSNLRDRAHATKIFVDGNYQLAPKYNFLYYVHIESTVYDKSKNIGMLVKSAQLPKFSLDLKKANVYNKTSWTQTKINYDPVSIVFHDDNADTVRDFWREYFKYYYRDTYNTETVFGTMLKTKYSDARPSNNWGYTQAQNEPFLKKITIYSLHKKRFSSYSLMNPIIRSFQHGEHQYGSSETMQNSMTVEYESVLYSQGNVIENEIPGFLDLRYDNHPSPLTPAGGGTASIAGQGGLLETISQVGDDIEQGNVGAALFKGVQGLRNASNMDLKNAAIGELLDMGKDILRGNNGTKNIFIPTTVGEGDSQGINSKPKWLASGNNIASMIRSGVSRINQEVTAATSFLSKSAPQGQFDAFPGIGSLLSLSSIDNSLVSTSSTSTVLPQALSSSGSTFPAESELNQVSDIKLSTNQVSLNDSHTKSTLRYNLSIAQQNKVQLQIEINSLKEQQQIAQDTIATLINKRNELLEEYEEFRNYLLINQLLLLIEQQQEFIATNTKTIDTKNNMITQFNNQIDVINIKLAGTV